MSHMSAESAMDKLTHIKMCADGKVAQISNQGQALDGYSELANYRQVIQEYADKYLGGK